MKRLFCLFLALCPIQVLAVDTEQLTSESPYERSKRIRYINEAIAYLSVIDSDRTDLYKEQIKLFHKTNCRSSVLELKVKCFVESSRKYCEENGGGDQCLKAMDFSQQDFLGSKTIFPLESRSSFFKNLAPGKQRLKMSFGIGMRIFRLNFAFLKKSHVPIEQKTVLPPALIVFAGKKPISVD